MKITIGQLAEPLGAELVGDGSRQIKQVMPVESACRTDITFVLNSSHIPRLKNSGAAAVLVAEQVEGLTKPQLIVENVNAALMEALRLFAPESKRPGPGIDPCAKIGRDAVIAPSASIGPLAVVEDGAEIGENSIVGAGCKIGANSKIGSNCRLDGNVVVYHNCTIGNNVVIQANTTIGSTGFGYYFVDGAHRLVPHNGTVVIEDFVEIGANCCIDRAKFGSTSIGAGTKIDNIVQIAHNVVIGKCCLIAGQTGIAGSSTLGDGVVLAGQVSIVDNIEIADGTVVGVKTGVIHSISKPGSQMFGIPATEKAEQFRIIALTRRLPKLVEQLKRLSKRIDKLERI